MQNICSVNKKIEYSKRIEWIDSLKGIGIIMVVLGHSGIPENINKYILSFHMPLFFFISGYLSNYSKYKFIVFVKKKINTLLKPYFIFSIISYIMWILMEKPFTNSNVNILKPLIGILYSTNVNDYMIFNGPLWFLTCLFIVEIIFFIIHNLLKSKIKIIFILAIMYFISEFFIINRSVVLPWSIEISLTAIIFFGIGFILKNNLKFDLINKNKIIFILLISIILNRYSVENNSNIYMYNNIYGDYFTFYIGALSGINICIIIANILKKSQLLKFYGENSIIILATHIKLILILRGLTEIIGIDIYGSYNSMIITGIIFTSIILVLNTFVIKYINNKIPWIIGKNI